MSDVSQSRSGFDRLALVAERLTRSYQSGSQAIVAVDQVSLQVARGEFVAIMGQSGSGKSTLLYLMSGLAEPSSGDVYITGTRLSTLTDSGRARLRNAKIGFVFQRFNLLNFLSVQANVEAPQLLASHGHRAKTRLAQELLEKVRLAGRRFDSVARLSAGEQQRVAIARALMNSPEILLADEPTGNLDTHNASKVLELLLSLRDELKITILMVTHNPEVALLADRILEMQDGRIRQEVSPHALESRDEWLRRFATPIFQRSDQ